MNQDVFHIGLRITKTGIAVFLCILIFPKEKTITKATALPYRIRLRR